MRELVAILVAAMLLSLSPVTSLANTGDGNEVLKQCSALVRTADGGNNGSDDLSGTAYCAGLMTGITSTMTIWNTTREKAGMIRIWCPPAITSQQAARIVVKYMNEHPDDLHRTGAYLVMSALQDAYPCEPELSK